MVSWIWREMIVQTITTYLVQRRDACGQQWRGNRRVLLVNRGRVIANSLQSQSSETRNYNALDTINKPL